VAIFNMLDDDLISVSDPKALTDS